MTNEVYGNELGFNFMNKLVSVLSSTWMPVMTAQYLTLTSAQQEIRTTEITVYLFSLEHKNMPLCQTLGMTGWQWKLFLFSNKLRKMEAGKKK